MKLTLGISAVVFIVLLCLIGIVWRLDFAGWLFGLMALCGGFFYGVEYNEAEQAQGDDHE